TTGRGLWGRHCNDLASIAGEGDCGLSDEGNLRRRLADALATNWAAKARPSQRLPTGDWSIWLLMAGRGYGKSRVLSEVANHWAATGQYGRMAIVGPNFGGCA